MTRLTVIVVTINRPECVRQCLECLYAQTPPPEQVIVVDASADDHTRHVVAAFDDAIYLRNEMGAGHMTTSRNIGLQHADGDVIAFVDDDAYVHSGWRDHLLDTYSDDTVGAVGGRVLNQQPNEAVEGVDRIGQLMPNGLLTGHFAADPGRVIELDHIMGCNMSFRREVLAQLGGFREDFPGVSGVREDSDMCLRVRRAGYRILFNPEAVVDHVGAPQVKGRRFDTRYAFYAAQNHCILLIRNYGLCSGIVVRNVLRSGGEATIEFVRRVGGACIRLAAVALGTTSGMIRGTLLLLRHGRDPVRRDQTAQSVTAQLGRDVPPKQSAGLVVEQAVPQKVRG